MIDRLLIPLFAACVFFVGATEFMIGPMMTPLGLAYGVAPADTSWLVSVYAISYALAAPAFGLLSDRINRRRLLRAALFLFVIDGIALAIAPAFEIALVLRLFGGLASAALIPTVFAMIADSVTEDRRAAVMGLVMMGMTLGIAGGPVAAGLLTDAIDWRAPYLASALGCFVVLVLSFQVSKSLGGAGVKMGKRAGVRRMQQPEVYMPLISKACWNGIGVTGLLTAGEVLRLRYANLSNGEIGLALSAFGAGLALGNIAIARVKSWLRTDEHAVIAAISLLSIAALALLVTPNAIIISVAAILLWGVALGFAAPASTSLLSVRAGTDRGFVLAVSESANNVIVLLGLPAAAYLLSSTGQVPVMFFIGGVLAFALLLSVLDVRHIGSQVDAPCQAHPMG